MDINTSINMIDKRLQSAKAARAPWERLWQMVLDVMNPNYGQIYTEGWNQNQGQRGDRRIYDSQGVKGLNRLSLALHSLMFSPTQKFMKFTLKNKRRYENSDRMQRWLAYVDEDINTSVSTSNFHNKINESIGDLGSIGWFTHLLETYPQESDRYGDFIFRAIPFEQHYPIVGQDGTVESFIREFQMTAEHILGNPELEKIASTIVKLTDAAKNEPDKKFSIVHYVTPKTAIYQPIIKTHEYVSVYYFKEGKICLNHENGYFRGYEEKPFATMRWETIPGEDYPRSPAMAVLGDAQSLQQLAKHRLTSAALATKPPTWEIEEQMAHDPRILPGARNVFKRPDAFGFIEPRQRMDVAYLENQKLLDNVNDGFYLEDFQLPKDLPQMTAMEAGIRNAIRQSIFSPIIVRSAYEYVIPIGIRMFWIRYRAGYYDVPPVPFDEKEITYQMVGPLAMAQMQNDVVMSEGFIRSAAELAPVLPEYMAKIDGSKYATWRAERTNTSFFDFLRDDEETQEILQQQAMQSQIPEGAQALRNVADAGLKQRKAESV